MTEGRSEGDLKLWQAWKGGDVTKLQPLIDRFKPAVEKWVAQHPSPNVPPVTLRTTAKVNLMNALKTYDPNRGANLNTHITWGLKKGLRVLQKHTNIARIPEPRANLIGDYQRAKASLEDKFGRPPSLDELRDYFAADTMLDPGRKKKFSRKVLSRLETELRHDRPMSGIEENFSEDEEASSGEVLSRDLVYQGLSGQDKLVFEHAFGFGGKSQLKNVQIAEMIGVSPTTIGKKIRKFKNEYQALL